MPRSFGWRSKIDLIDITNGERLKYAGDKINTFMTNVSADYLQMIHTYHDAHQNQIVNIKFSQCDATVVAHLTGYNYEFREMDNLIMTKYEQAPVDHRLALLRWYFDPWLMQQKAALENTSRAVYFDDSLAEFKFANNKALYDNYGDTTGMIGNIYPLSANTPLSGSFDLIVNGMFYDYGHTPLIPGMVYYLSDSMDGWLVPYQEGGGLENISLPFAIAIDPHAAVLLTERAVIKQLPCYEYCPPFRLRFEKDPVFTEYLDISDGDPWSDPSVIKYSEYTSVAGGMVAPSPWNNPSIKKYNLYMWP